MIIFKIILLPFQIIEKLVSSNSKVTYKRKKYNNESSFDKESNLWGLSKEDRQIAKQERMSPADYIESLERDDDNLDSDD